MIRAERHLVLARQNAAILEAENVPNRVKTAAAMAATVHYLGYLAETSWNKGMPYEAIEQVEE